MLIEGNYCDEVRTFCDNEGLGTGVVIFGFF